MARPYIEEISFGDPAALFAPFAADPWAVFLDSSLTDDGQGRHAFIGLDPFLRLTLEQGVLYQDDTALSGSDAWARLGDVLGRYKAEKIPGLPPFQGGAMGWFGYEMGALSERLQRPPAAGLETPDMMIGLYDLVIAFDLIGRRCWIISRGFPEKAAAARQQRAAARARWLKGRLDQPPVAPASACTPSHTVCFNSNFSRPSYEHAVQRMIDYILAGDIFEANLTQRFAARLPADFDRFAHYRRLRASNSAPFGAFLNYGRIALASSSPERFLALEDGQASSRPIKGTRPRGSTPQADRAWAEDLRASAKDRAENVMIVDLLRNDLSKVCADHSIRVPELCVLESYASVHHLVSTVSGTLRPGLGAVDLLRAAFPGGSITGAPKVRAMEIISELEGLTRGPYCGAIGWLGFDGDMDLNIAIRTLSYVDEQVFCQAGGAVTAQSEPAAEYAESLDKIRPILDSFTLPARVAAE